MDRGIIISSLIFWCLRATCCSAEKLSVDQKAPLFARGSGGLVLDLPFEGRKAVGPASPAVDGVQRDEKESYKTVDGQVVRVVEGSFSYKSPEGIPVAVMYTADENGNRASFRLGAAASGGGSSSGTSGGRPSTGNRGNRPGGAGGGGGGGGRPASDTYLPPNKDRMYLPPN